jgi:hypothetical protein
MQENLQGEKIYLIIDLLKETISENTNEQTPHILDAIRNRMREQYPQ